MKFKYLKILLCTTLVSLFSINGYSQIWEYEVKKGDTLWDIADDYFIDVFYYKRLQKLNNVKNPYLLQPGRMITAPVEWLGSLPGKAELISKFGLVVIIKNNQQNITPPTGYKIESEDSLNTGADSTATIEFSDGSLLTVYPKTNLNFKVIQQSANGKVLKARLLVTDGRIDVIINKENSSNRRLEIESPSAVTAVRGTVFRIGVDGDSADTVTEVLSGTVEVTALGSKKKTAVGKGLGTKTNLDGNPIPPVSLLSEPTIEEQNEINGQLGSLHWKKLDEAVYYRIRVATDKDFINTIYNKTTFDNRVDDIYFLDNGDYYFTVRGGDKNNIEGLDSTTKNAVNAFPLPPLILTPPKITVSQGSTPRFDWHIITNGVKSLQFQLSTVKDFDSVIVDKIMKPNNRFRLKENLEKGQYYWRVAAIGDKGRGGFSSPALLIVE